MSRRKKKQVEVDVIVPVMNVTECDDAYFITTIQNTPKLYFHPHPETGYTLQPERVGAAVFKKENAERLIKTLETEGMIARKGKNDPEFDLTKRFKLEHVMDHTKVN